MTTNMTIELLKNDLTLQRLRHNLQLMTHLSNNLKETSSVEKCKAETIILNEMIDSRTQCLSNCQPSTCNCIEERITELTNSGKLEATDHIIDALKGFDKLNQE